MKYLLLAIILQIFSFQVLAEKVQSKISSLDKGTDGQSHLVKLANGQVAFIEFGQKSLLQQIEKSYLNKDWLELTLGKRNALKSIQIITPRFTNETNEGPTRIASEGEPYEPSIVSLSKATSIFRNMRRDYQNKSQCFNRAHIWTYEEFIKSQTNTNKVFLFFTSRYIRNYHFGWWFHVTPMIYVGGSKYANWKMLDRRYTSGPLSPKTWTDVFIKSKRSCKVVRKYSDYDEHQQAQDCYLFPASMYYLVPSDLERVETSAEERFAYDEDEVDYALWEAF